MPILLNNTDVGNVRYTITPLGFEGEGAGKIEYVELGARELKAIEVGRVESLLAARPGGTANGGGSSKRDTDDDEYDEYDDSDPDEQDHKPADSDPNAPPPHHHPLQKTQSITHIRLKKPGTVRLERVLDASSNTAARLVHPVEVTVVPCPTAEFVPDQVESVRCAAGQSNPNSKGDDETDLRFMIDIKGVPPLSLRWYKEVNGKREHFLVEGIEGEHLQQHRQGDDGTELPLVVGTGRRKSRVPRELKIPLEVSLDVVGRHTYVLEEVIDGVNNAVSVDHLPSTHKLPFGLGLTTHEPTNATPHQHHPNTKTTRSLSVLRRPSISFTNCVPGTPTSLLIGSEAPLTISASEADPMDAPWDVEVVYRPFGGDGSGGGSEEGAGKRYKAWKKSLTTLKGKRELSLRASAPGEYTIVGVKGKVRLLLLFGVEDG